MEFPHLLFEESYFVLEQSHFVVAGLPKGDSTLTAGLCFCLQLLYLDLLISLLLLKQFEEVDILLSKRLDLLLELRRYCFNVKVEGHVCWASFVVRS